jgi:DnaJ-class molecular chaperone
MTDYYTLLKIDRSAKTDDVNRAFRKMSLKHHPDRGGNENTFKELSHAAGVLTDPVKRAIYDKHGADWETASQKKRQCRREDLIIQQVFINISRLGTDIENTLTIERNTLCKPCKGLGYPGAKSLPCTTCRGQGMIITMLGGMIPQQAMCPECRGKKVTVNSFGIQGCKECNSRGHKLEPYVHKFTIYAGTPDGYEYLFEDAGHEVEEDFRAPVVIVSKHVNVPNMKINPNGDIIQLVPIRLDHALRFTPIRVPSILTTPDQNMNVEIISELGTTEPIQHNSTRALPEYGIRISRDFTIGGSIPPEIDVVVGKWIFQFNIVLPSAIGTKHADAEGRKLGEALVKSYGDKPELDHNVAVPDDSGYKCINWSELKDPNVQDSSSSKNNDNQNAEQNGQPQCRQM